MLAFRAMHDTRIHAPTRSAQPLAPRQEVELTIFVAKHMGAVSIYCISRVVQDPEIAYITVVYVIDGLICAGGENEELISNRAAFVGRTCVQESLETVALYAVGLGQHVREALQKARHVLLLKASSQAVQKAVSDPPL